jgi:hypothetical protein
MDGLLRPVAHGPTNGPFRRTGVTQCPSRSPLCPTPCGRTGEKRCGYSGVGNPAPLPLGQSGTGLGQGTIQEARNSAWMQFPRVYGAEALMKSPPGPPMTLGNAAAARVRLIVWCKACGHQVEPDAAEMAARYGTDTTILAWRERLVCSQCGSRDVDMGVTGTERR